MEHCECVQRVIRSKDVFSISVMVIEDQIPSLSYHFEKLKKSQSDCMSLKLTASIDVHINFVYKFLVSPKICLWNSGEATESYIEEHVKFEIRRRFAG